MSEPIEVTRDLINVFDAAWEAKSKEIGRGRAAKGTRTRAGLEAVMDHLARQGSADDHRGAARPVTAADRLADAEREDAEWLARPSTCLACPDGCGSCTRDESDCECYDHQNDHPDADTAPYADGEAR